MVFDINAVAKRREGEKATDMTCITYRRVARVYELFERGRI